MPVDMQIEVSAPQFVPLGSIEGTLLVPLGRVMMKELDHLERRIKPVYSNWTSDSQPEWERDASDLAILGLADTFEARLETRSAPYRFVSGGTDVGYAAFSRDYRAMSRPRTLRTRARQGRVKSRGRRHAPQFAGIEAREFEQEAAKRRQKPFERAVLPVIVKALQRVLGKPGTDFFIIRTL